jgi:hypothetical protein
LFDQFHHSIEYDVFDIYLNVVVLQIFEIFHIKDNVVDKVYP